VTDVTIRPISPDQHEAVMHFFDLVAYADNPNWSKCYCMERLAEDFEARKKEQNRSARSELILGAKANGLVAYRLGRVVGWCHAAPKSELMNIPGPSAQDTGAVVCFVVAPDQRNQGIATALLGGALAYLRHRGVKTVEAYPVMGEIPPEKWVFRNYVGPLEMYLKAGFEIAEPLDGQAVVRRTL
jgi:GNAT superfamily N-acetyltransferase